MQIDYRRPTSRGVTQLMYVGDDGLPTGGGILGPLEPYAGLIAAGLFLYGMFRWKLR